MFILTVSNTLRYFLVQVYSHCWSQTLNLFHDPQFWKNTSFRGLFTKGLFPLSTPPKRKRINKRWQRLRPSVTVSSLGGLWGKMGKEGKGRVGRMERTKRKERAVRHLDSELLAEVGEEILVPVGSLAAQPHHVVRAPRDPAANQLQDPTQTLLLGGKVQRQLTLFRSQDSQIFTQMGTITMRSVIPQTSL